MSVSERTISKKLKAFTKAATSSKTEAEFIAVSNDFISDLKIWIVSLDNSRLELPKSDKKLITEVFLSLEARAKEKKSSFVDENFVYEFNQVSSVITAFSKETELIQLIWRSTFWIMSFSFSRISINTWEPTILSFFTALEDFSLSLMSIVMKEIVLLSSDEAKFWWKIFVHMILPQYINFPMLHPPSSKQSRSKKLTRNALSVFSPFLSTIASFKPRIDIFTVDDIDSCFATASLLLQIVYDVTPPEVLHEISANIFPLRTRGEIAEGDKSAYAFCHLTIDITEEEKQNYRTIIQALRNSKIDFIGCLAVLLLMDVEYNSHNARECGISVFRLNFFVKLFLELENITKTDIMIISGAFFFATARKHCEQLFRLFAEFTYISKELSDESCHYLKTILDSDPVVVPIIKKFISQVTVSATDAIFGVPLQNLLTPADVPHDAISIEAYLMGTSDSSPPFFGPLEPCFLTYEEFENYISKLLSFSPISENIEYIGSFALAIDRITKVIPLSTNTHLSELCLKILRTIPDDVLGALTNEALYYVSLLLSHCTEIPEEERNKYTGFVLAKLPETLDEMYILAYSPPFAAKCPQLIEAAASSMLENWETVTNKQRVNILISSFSLAKNKIIDVDIDTVSSVIQNTFIADDAQYNLLMFITEYLEGETGTYVTGLYQKVLDNYQSNSLTFISALSYNFPSFFKSDSMIIQLFDVCKKLRNNPEAFDKALIAAQDACVFSRQLSMFLNFLDSFGKCEPTIASLINVSKQAAFEGCAALKWGERGAKGVVKTEDESNFLLEENHLLGISSIKIDAITPSAPEEIKEEESSSEESPSILDEEIKISSKFENVLTQINQFTSTKPEDFSVTVPDIPVTKRQVFDFPDISENEEKSAYNSFATCMKEFTPQFAYEGKTCFERFNANILLPDKEESDNFKSFVKILGEREENLVTFTCYRMSITYKIIHSFEEIDSTTIIIWNDHRQEFSFDSNRKFLYLSADLFPVITAKASKQFDFFQGNSLYSVETLGKLLPWEISTSEQNSGQKTIRKEILEK